MVSSKPGVLRVLFLPFAKVPNPFTTFPVQQVPFNFTPLNKPDSYLSYNIIFFFCFCWVESTLVLLMWRLLSQTPFCLALSFHLYPIMITGLFSVDFCVGFVFIWSESATSHKITYWVFQIFLFWCLSVTQFGLIAFIHVFVILLWLCLVWSLICTSLCSLWLVQIFIMDSWVFRLFVMWFICYWLFLMRVLSNCC